MRIVEAGACSFIPLGIRGENLATEVQFDISRWQQYYGEGTAQLIAQRQSDASPYPVTTTQDGGTVSWVVTGADTAEAGVGSCELLYFVGETLAKSMTWSTKVRDSLDPADTDPPEPQQGWVEQVLAAAQAAEDAQTGAESAQEAAENAQQKAEDAQDAAETAQTGAEAAQGLAEDAAEDAEAYAVGTRGGTAVPSGDPAYNNNAKYYSEQAEDARDAAQTAQGLAEDAQEAAETAQAAAEAAAYLTDKTDNDKQYTMMWSVVLGAGGDPAPCLTLSPVE